MKKTLSVLVVGLILSSLAVTASAAHTFEADQGNVAFGVKGINTEWAADGTWADGEYYEVEYKDSWVSVMTGLDDLDDQTRNLNPKIGMSWDAENIYVCMQYTDPDGYDFNGTDHSGFWNGDIVQFSGAEADAEGGDARLEIGLGTYSDTNEEKTINWADYLASGYFVDGTASADDFEVTVNGNDVTYEYRVPFAAFSEVAPAVGAQYRVCLVLNWTDGDAGQYASWQLASGCSGGKAAENHALVTLEAAPEIVVEDPAAGTEAPITADAGIVAAAAVMAVAAGVVLSKKH